MSPPLDDLFTFRCCSPSPCHSRSEQSRRPPLHPSWVKKSWRGSGDPQTRCPTSGGTSEVFCSFAHTGGSSQSRGRTLHTTFVSERSQETVEEQYQIETICQNSLLYLWRKFVPYFSVAKPWFSIELFFCTHFKSMWVIKTLTMNKNHFLKTKKWHSTLHMYALWIVAEHC